MRIGKRWTGYLAAGLFLLCAAGLVWLLRAETVPQREPVRLSPEAVSGAPEMENLPLYQGPLSLKYTLPVWEGRLRPMLEIRQLYAAAELEVDGMPFQQIRAGQGYCYITLPADWAGKTLTLTLEKEKEDAVPSLYLTDPLTIVEQAGADACLRAFPAAAYGMIFLLTLGLFLYGWAKGDRFWPVLLLSMAALGQTAYFYLQNLPNASLPPALYGIVLQQSRAFLYAAPALYLMLGMKKRRKAFAPFVILPSLIYFVVAGFQTVVPPFSNIAAYTGIVFCFTIAALIVCAVLEYRDGNPVFRLFLPGLGACAAAAAALCAVSVVQTGALPPILLMFLREPFSWLDTELFYWNVLLLMLCFVESVADHVRCMSRQEAELQVLSARECLIREQLATVLESASALGEMRHEMKNHYLVLQNLCCAGESERLEAYLNTLVSEAASIPALTYAPHPTVNAVLTTMLARAQKQGIQVERHIDVPETLPFPDAELCTVLMNLLQNALDANAKAPEGGRKWLRVDLHTRGVHLYIRVENARFAPVDYDVKTGLCRTTKADNSTHGYGLKAVRAVAQKYCSELLLKFPEGSFSAATALQMPDTGQGTSIP